MPPTTLTYLFQPIPRLCWAIFRDKVVSVNSDVCFTNPIIDLDGNNVHGVAARCSGRGIATVVDGTNLVICISPALKGRRQHQSVAGGHPPITACRV